jgi:hypothetical protein
MSYLYRIMRCQRGAVTIDWVILAAAVCLMGWAAVDPIFGGVTNMMETVADAVEASGAVANSRRLGEE